MRRAENPRGGGGDVRWIDVYQGPNQGTGQYDIWNTIISANAEKVISDSWGTCEAVEKGSSFQAAENKLFQEAATQGQTIVAASGDSGSDGCARRAPEPGRYAQG